MDPFLWDDLVECKHGVPLSKTCDDCDKECEPDDACEYYTGNLP